MELVKFLAVFLVLALHSVKFTDSIVLGESTPLTIALRDLRNNFVGLATEETQRTSALRQKTDELLNCEECQIPAHLRAGYHRPNPRRPTRSESSAANVELVDSLKAQGVIRSSRVASAMSQIDRGDFSVRNPYNNAPQNIGYGATISAPYMHAHALEALEPKLKAGARALDVGSGSGYVAAAMSVMVGSTGKVVGIEHIDQLVKDSIENVRKHHAHLLDGGQLQLVTGDGRLGYASEGPYDAIHVGAAAANVPQGPQALINQLKPGGRLVIPVGPAGANQMLEQIDKLPNGQTKRTSLLLVRFVPLTSQDNQWPRNRGQIGPDNF